MAKEVGVVDPKAETNDIEIGDDRGHRAEEGKVTGHVIPERHVERGTEHRVRENCRHLDASVSG